MAEERRRNIDAFDTEERPALPAQYRGPNHGTDREKHFECFREYLGGADVGDLEELSKWRTPKHVVTSTNATTGLRPTES